MLEQDGGRSNSIPGNGCPARSISDTTLRMERTRITEAREFPFLALWDQLGKQFRAGVGLYLGDQIAPFGDKLWLVPVPALWTP
jgi:hypothetical protein